MQEESVELTTGLTLEVGFGCWRLPGGPVGSDLPASQPLTVHLLDGVLRILSVNKDMSMYIYIFT